jgi:hypothetical protein
MKGRISPRRRKMLLLATLPLVAGLVVLAQPDTGSAESTCGYVSAQVASVSTTVTIVNYCDGSVRCPGVFGNGPNTVGNGDPAKVSEYLCITGV